MAVLVASLWQWFGGSGRGGITTGKVKPRLDRSYRQYCRICGSMFYDVERMTYCSLRCEEKAREAEGWLK
jgi:hypothetical protein